ncbi:MAG TPA: hypothetical protein DCQ15_00140 [Chitinophagaceae bacterium]|nr:hypothetical protein [Chitinophagaceae bacterium]HAZ93024.1 hypothetical protein [Chitinophagaceae bacterium]
MPNYFYKREKKTGDEKNYTQFRYGLIGKSMLFKKIIYWMLRFASKYIKCNGLLFKIWIYRVSFVITKLVVQQGRALFEGLFSHCHLALRSGRYLKFHRQIARVYLSVNSTLFYYIKGTAGKLFYCCRLIVYLPVRSCVWKTIRNRLICFFTGIKYV